ncbi:MAG: hypothetical protein IPM08_04590 [Actinomycetales bacterium]|nr:hypothetical protein [Actinomycetales bacterium]
MTTELVIGAQRHAAGIVAGSAPVLGDALKALGQGISEEAPGFTGAAASAFYAAFGGWAKTGGRIPEAVMQYAGRLVEVDRAVAQSQATQSAAYLRARRQLAGL